MNRQQAQIYYNKILAYIPIVNSRLDNIEVELEKLDYWFKEWPSFHDDLKAYQRDRAFLKNQIVFVEDTLADAQEELTRVETFLGG